MVHPARRPQRGDVSNQAGLPRGLFKLSFASTPSEDNERLLDKGPPVLSLALDPERSPEGQMGFVFSVSSQPRYDKKEVETRIRVCIRNQGMELPVSVRIGPRPHACSPFPDKGALPILQGSIRKMSVSLFTSNLPPRRKHLVATPRSRSISSTPLSRTLEEPGNDSASRFECRDIGIQISKQ